LADENAYPYSTVPNRLREVLAKIPTIGRPERATQAWLKGLGYTGGNDMSVLAVMRRVGIIGANGVPTGYWDALRTKSGSDVASHVKSAYEDLFSLYPNAHRQDDEALRNFFRSKTTAGEKAQGLMIRTFRVLCEPAEFGTAPAAPATMTVPTGPEGETPLVRDQKNMRAAAARGLTLNVNIQLELPASSDGEVYDKLFEAMGKHLKGLATLE
jgi:Family of unknown function (DUF5343)